MAAVLPEQVIRHLRRDVLLQEGDGITDGQLLESFLTRREEVAFELLVRRHGPMVLGVCRRVLRNAHDAEDAFQATFLVLFHKAASLRSRDNLGGWLYGVASHLALKSWATTMKRRAKQGQLRQRFETAALPEDGPNEAQPLLDQELSRLPEKYREAVVLCELQGKTRKEAARLLGIPEGTLSGRLTTARRRLARRLSRRGLGPSGAPLAASLPQAATPACVPAGLLRSTVLAAAALTAGPAAAVGAISVQVASLTEGVLKAMFLDRLKLAGALLLLLGTLGAAGRNLAVQTRPAGQGRPPAQVKRSRTPEPPNAAPRARAVLKEAAETARGIMDAHGKAWALLAVARARAGGGDKAGAARTFQEAIGAAKEGPAANGAVAPPGQSRDTLTWIAAAQAESGDFKGALETAEAIADREGREQALEQIACARVGAGGYQAALKAAEPLPVEKRNWVRVVVVTAQARAGKLRAAEQTARKITGEVHQAFAVVAIARAQVKARRFEEAQGRLQKALKLAGNVDPAGDGQHVVRLHVAQVQAEMGHLDKARQTAASITKATWRDRAFNRLVVVQAQTADLQGALKTARAIDGKYCRGQAVTDVLKAHLRSGDHGGARKTASLLRHPYWRVVALAEMARAQAKAGDAATAARTFREALEEAGPEGRDIPDVEPGIAGLRNAALYAVVRAQAEAAQDKQALAWARKQSPPFLRSQALVSIALGLLPEKRE
jgi:RNA polymerase sigma factor (sigma-70 family)